MRFKIFLAVLANLALVAFPYNIIGCAGSDDPYDYFTSFFDPRLGNNSELKPFYYTYNFLYDYEEPIDQWKTTAADWSVYTGVQASEKEALDLSGNYTHAQLQNIYSAVETGKPSSLPDSVSRNRLLQKLMLGKDLEAIGYLMYLRKIQPYVVTGNSWDPPARDSVKMASWAKNGTSLYNAAKKDFFRQRYAYQVMRLLLYNNDADGALQWYDKESAVNVSASVHELSASLRAGALYRRGDKAQAAYHFCQLFAEGKMKKISNYYGFHVYTEHIPPALILGYCKTDKERANVLSTIAMGNPATDLRTLERISRLSPGDKMLDMLAVREINKLEEKYLSPTLPAGSYFFQYNYFYEADKTDSVTEKQVRETADWMGWMADNKSTSNPGLYATGSAYLHYMVRDYAKAREWIANAKSKGLKGEVADQCRLTELLVTINEHDVLNKEFEEKLLPSVQWLEKKANADKTGKGYYADGPWTRFYRNLFNSVIVPRYKKQGDTHKAMLAAGTAESISAATDNGYSFYALSEARNNLGSADALRMEKLINDPKANSFEKYMVSHSTIAANDVRDFIGTAFLREDKLEEALSWFMKVEPKYYKTEPYTIYMAANPFADLLEDTHAPTKQDTVMYTKVSFTKKMISLKKQFTEGTDANKKAAAAYELAKGYYHMSYFGNSWLLVAYDWSGSEPGLPDSTKPWTGNYYHALRAEQWYTRAFDLSTNKEFKAKALFMIAKCVQKRETPTYYAYKDYDKYVKAMEEYWAGQLSNPVFKQLKSDYSSTTFYKRALNTCSYLKDFHTGKTKMPGL